MKIVSQMDHVTNLLKIGYLIITLFVCLCSSTFAGHRSISENDTLIIVFDQEFLQDSVIIFYEKLILFNGIIENKYETEHSVAKELELVFQDKDSVKIKIVFFRLNNMKYFSPKPNIPYFIDPTYPTQEAKVYMPSRSVYISLSLKNREKKIILHTSIPSAFKKEKDLESYIKDAYLSFKILKF